MHLAELLRAEKPASVELSLPFLQQKSSHYQASPKRTMVLSVQKQNYLLTFNFPISQAAVSDWVSPGGHYVTHSLLCIQKRKRMW